LRGAADPRGFGLELGNLIYSLINKNMSYCSLDEAWGNKTNSSGERRKRKVPPMVEIPHLKEQSDEPVDTRRFSRDINTQREHNGPEERYHVEPIQMEEEYMSQQGSLDQVYKPAEFEKHYVSPQQQQLTFHNNTNNNNNTPATGNNVNEMDWIKEQLQVITEKLATLSSQSTLSSSSTSSGYNNPTADLLLYLSTGLLTIFMVDIMLKKRT